MAVRSAWYADARLHGSHVLRDGDEIPTPMGGGGADFRPFFEMVKSASDARTSLAIYLTDGMVFPEQPPAVDVLWVVTVGGLALESFPFGEAVRMVD